jgi:hypothetical protein
VGIVPMGSALVLFPLAASLSASSTELVQSVSTSSTYHWRIYLLIQPAMVVRYEDDVVTRVLDAVSNKSECFGG